MNKEKSFVFFPEHRLTPEYPFGVWLAGSYALAKGIMWLYLSNPSPGILLFPFFLLFGFGVWNFKRWAFWGLIGVTSFELVFYLLTPVFPMISPFVEYGIDIRFGPIERLFHLLVGPAGDLILLVAILGSVRHFPKNKLVPNREK